MFDRFGYTLVRYGIGIVFLLLGIDQFVHPSTWIGYLPMHGMMGFLTEQGSETYRFILINSLFDMLLGMLLLMGIFTRIVASLAVIHLGGIIIISGYSDIVIRDFGLLLAALAIALRGADEWCLETRWKKHSNS